MIINKIVGFYVVIIFLSIELTGCAGIRGAPETVIQADKTLTDLNAYLQADVLTKAVSPNPKDRNNLDPRAWRDIVIDARITMTDLYFRDFIHELHSQGTGFNILSDFAVLGMSAAGALASGGTTNVLAAASAGVTGARGAVDKDVYYRETLPGLIRTMEANRKEILVEIKRKMKDRDETQYSLGDALYDLQQYENASTINSALNTITSNADDAAKTADVLLNAPFTATVLPKTDFDRFKKLSDFIRGLEKAGDKPKLDAIAKILNVTDTSTIKKERQSILLELDKRITSDGVSMNDISSQLKQVTKQDF